MIELSEIKSLRSRVALTRFIEKRFGGNCDEFIDASSKTVSRFIATDIREAQKMVDALGLISRHLPSRFEPNLVAMRARVSQWAGDHRRALELYLRARDLFRKQRDFRAVALIGQGLMDTQMYLGRYDEAISTGKKSLRYFKKKRMLSNEAKVLSNIGNVYHRMDRNRLALSYYDKARGKLATGDSVAIATVDYNRANIFANLNKLDAAVELYRSAGEAYAAAGLGLYESKARYSLAYVCFLKDEFAEALRIFEEVYATFVEFGDRRAAAITLLDLVEVNLHLNQLGTALHLGEEVMNQFKVLGMQYEQAKASYFIGSTHLKLGENKLAGRFLRRSTSLFRKGGNNLWLGIVSLAQAELLLKRGNIKAAFETTRHARQLFKKSGDERRSSDADIHLVRIMLRNGSSRAGVSKAKALLARRLVGYQVYDLHLVLGQYYGRTRRHRRALDHFKRAVAALENMVAGLHSDEVRFFFVLDRLDAYSGVVDSLTHLGRCDSSFLSNLRALSVINKRRDKTRLTVERVPRRLLEARSELRASIKKLSIQSGGDFRSQSPDADFYEAEQRLWAIERRIRAFSHEPLCKQVDDFAFHGATALLRKGESVVNFHSTSDGRIGVFCGTRDNVCWVPLKTPLERIRAIAWELNFVTERAVYGPGNEESCIEVQKHYLKQLHSLLLAPILPNLSTNKLILVADGVFAQVPFMALIDAGGKYFRDSFSISTVICPDDLRLTRSPRIRFKNRRNAIFGVPGSNIPAVTAEAERIGSLFRDSELFLGERADCETLRASLATAKGFVHIAAHAARSSENPLFSRISMGDGPLYPFDLYARGVAATLVTLSGCQTAAPGLYFGNSYTLAKAFHQAGGRYVLASLWPVSDRLSAAFMVLFYEALVSLERVPQAYISAIDQMSRLSANPAYWSGFVLLGI